MARQEASEEFQVDQADALESQREESADGASRSRHRPASAPRSSRSSSGGSTFLLGFLGTLFVGGGAALTLSARFSPALARFDQRLIGAGFDHGSMIFGGLVLFALGMVARKLSTLEREQADGNSQRSDLLLAIDQLATDSSQLLTSVLHTNEELAILSDGQKNVIDQQRSLAERQMDGAKDGLFRLAASVDKLHARIDERFHEVDVHVRSRFEGLQTSLHETRAALEQRLTVRAEAPRAVLPKEEAPRIEFFEALERMEGRQPAPHAQDPSAAPFPSGDVDPLTGLLPSEVRRIMSRRDPT